MPKYIVTKYVDAYLPYTAEIEAFDEEAAKRIARENHRFDYHNDIEWTPHDAITYDHAEFEVEELAQ